jgi:hypothetical protein
VAANFTLTLDTTGPAGVTAAIDAGNPWSVDFDVILNVGTSDGSTAGYQMKVWGDIAGGPATEAAASWQTFNAALPVTVTAGDGLKTLNVRLRDDVWNESTVATDTITVDSTAPTVAVTSDVTRISKIAGKRTATLTITPDSDIQAWKVKVVSSSGAVHTQGTQIGTTNGSDNMTGGASSSGVGITAHIDGRDLEVAGAEGDNIIKAFVQDLAGNWSVA